MDCPLPYQIKDDYYIDVNDFAEDFIKFSNTLGIDDLSQMLELLLIDVYWEVYKKDALILSKRSHDVLATLSSLRNKSKMSKDLIDDVRGMLLTKEFSKDNGENDFDLNKYNLKKEETVMIGDASSDVTSAKEAGVTSIGVLWGYGDDKTNLIKNSDYVVQNTEELKKCLGFDYSIMWNYKGKEIVGEKNGNK